MTGASEASGAPLWAPGYRHRTAGVPAVPCAFRERLEDFRVEEVPLYEPSGAGEHVLLTVEKRGLSTEDAARRLARALGARAGDVGWAGRKDARAVAVQRLSVAGVDADAARAVDVPGLRVLDAARHGHKLRRGHLAGNRFTVTLRGVDEAARPRVGAVLAELVGGGLPNAYGEQRFGRGGRGHELGLLLARGEHAAYLAALAGPPHARPCSGPADAERARALLAGGRPPARAEGDALGRRLGAPWDRVLRALRRTADPRELVAAVPRPLRVLHVSALQAHLFDEVLFARLDDLDRLVPGDVAWVHASGAAFAVDAAEAAAAAARAGRFELSPSGPLWGPRTLRAAGAPGAVEAAGLERAGLEPGDVARADRVGPGAGARGARRPLRAPLTELTWQLSGGVLELRFRLPPGAYATVLVEELRKRWSPPPAAGGAPQAAHRAAGASAGRGRADGRGSTG